MPFVLDHAQNAGLLAYLRDRSGTDVDVERPPPDVDRWRLGTHPDIVEHLWDALDGALPGDAAFLVAHGPALVHPDSGVVLALGLGTTYALRLTPDHRQEAVAAGAETVHRYGITGTTLDLAERFGPDWVFGRHDEREPGWLAESYRAANL